MIPNTVSVDCCEVLRTFQILSNLEVVNLDMQEQDDPHTVPERRGSF